MQKRLSVISAVSASLLLLFSCGKTDEKQMPAQGPLPFPVRTVAAADVQIFDEYSATLEGQQNVEIRPKVDGFIQKIYVDEGQQVKKGQLLFKIETQTLNQDASAAKANVQAAQVEVDRLRPLVERKIIGDVQLATAKARLAQAKSQYQGVAAAISYGSIKSPANGVIGSIPFREGSLVSAANQQPLTTVSDTKIVFAYFSMNEKQLLQYNKTFEGSNTAQKLKNTPEVSLRLVDESIYDNKGKLATMSGLVDAVTGTTQFRADFQNPQGILRSGNSAVLLLPIIQKNVILVPQNAVFEMQGKQILYVVDQNNKVQSRIITTNGISDLNFIVTDGLKPGERIVTEGASKLRDGVEIDPQSEASQSQTNQSASPKK